MTATTDSTSLDRQPFLALALSGGGSRAMAFHLGCLRALNDRGLLAKVRVLSTVSGGSVIGACFAYWNGDFAEFDRRVAALLCKGIQGSIAVSAIFSTELPKILITLLVNGTLSVLLAIAGVLLRWLHLLTSLPTLALESQLLRWSRLLPVWGSLTTAFERALARTLFGSTNLSDVKRDNLEVVINACDLRTGTAFRFGSRSSGGWRYGRLVGREVSVAKAVAASAAFPLLLPPLIETFDFERRGQLSKATVVLTDGGIFENLGVSVLEPGRATEVSINTYPATHIISLNAGPGQLDGDAMPFWWAGRVKQSFETVHRKVQDNTYSRLHAYVEAGRLNGFAMVYLGQQDDRLPSKPADLVPRAAVQYYPTDFAPMSAKNLAALSKRGEQLTQIVVERYLKDLV